MIVNVANPIYDSVFKYLMEDERIARTLLSALLKKDVVSVQIRRHEYTNGSRDKISMFRIDFGAQVRESDGQIKLVLIELQKTWLETETLRFRQYLGAQYSNPENVPKDNNPRGYAIPMVSVYLLGHRVGDIDEPVVYVHHKAYDYDGNLVNKGIPDAFVDSLTHDSIIVQIPLLRGQVNNRLEWVLSIFDQTATDNGNRQVLNIDESKYSNDDDMMYILRRLTAAAANSQLRQDMNVEDEYFSAIENRDTAIMLRDEKLKEQNKQLKEQDQKLKEQDELLKNRDELLKNRDEQLKNRDEQLKSREEQLKSREEQLKNRDEQLKNRDEQLKNRDNTIDEQARKLAEQDSVLRKSVKSLKAAGLTVDGIALSTGLSLEQVNDLLKQ